MPLQCDCVKWGYIMSNYNPNFVHIAEEAERLIDVVHCITGEEISIDTAVKCIVTLENTKKLHEIAEEIYNCT